MYLIVGLGNPGRDYINTRHNIGFEAVDAMAAKFHAGRWKAKFRAEYAEASAAGEKVLLVKPQTFMNLSGESVAAWKEYYKLNNGQIIVVYDDKDLPTGKLRIRPKGSAGGHNGIKNIIYQLGSEEFPRVRIGIGSPAREGFSIADYVLGRFSKEEVELLIPAVVRASEAVETIIRDGVLAAMNRFNG